MMIRRANKAMALAVSAGLLTAASGLYAQEFSFETNKILGSPGETVEVPVYVTGVADPVGGVNFTLRVQTSDLADIQLDQATTSSTLTGSGFTYAFNSMVTRTGVSTGAVQGDVTEFRGVIYGTGDPAPSFNATTPVKIASVLVPIGPMADGLYPIALETDFDGEVAVGGISDEVGNSITDGGVRPGGDDIVLDITSGMDPITVDFTDPAGRAGWIYTGQLPGEVMDQPVGTTSAIDGLEITTVADNSFGYWGYDPNIGSNRNPDADILHFIEWDSRTSANGGDAPNIRLRHAAANFFQSAEIAAVDFGNFVGDNGFFSPPGTAGKTYTTVFEVPAYSTDGSAFDGINYFFDLIQFGLFDPPFNLGLVGETASLSQVREYFISKTALTNPSIVYDETYTDITGFTTGPPDSLGRTVTFSQDARGLGVTSGGGIAPGEEFFSFGGYSSASDLGFNFDSSKVYKIDVVVSAEDQSDMVFEPFWAPGFFVRLYPENNELTYKFVVNPTSVFDPAVPGLSSTDQTYTFWLNPLPVADGLPVRASLELLQIITNPSGTDENVSIFFQGMTITSYDKPTLN